MGPMVAGILVSAVVGGSILPRPTDGTLYLVPSARTPQADLFLIDPVAGNARNITRSDAAEEIFPAWSPDGRRVAFACRTREHGFELFVCDADGSSRRQLTTPPGAGTACLAPCWSSDGTRIAYTRLFPGEKAEVRIVQADGSDDVRLVDGAASPAWSPDGKSIAVVKFNTDGKTGQLVVVAPDGTGERMLVPQVGTKSYCYPAWSPDGRVLAYSAEVPGALQLFLIPAAGGTPRQLTHLPGLNMSPVWIATDRLMFSHFTQPGQPTGVYTTIKANGTRLEVHPLTKTETAHVLVRPAVFFPRPAVKPQPPVGVVRPAAFATPVSRATRTLYPVALIPPAAPGPVTGLAWSADGKRLALASAGGVVPVVEFDGRGARPVELLRGHEGPAVGVAFAPDGKVLYTTGADRSLRVWDIGRGGTREILKDHAEFVGAVAVSADGKRLATGGQDGVVKLRDVKSGEPVHEVTLDARKAAVHAVAFGKGGVLFAAGGRGEVAVLGGVLVAIDCETGKPLWRAKGTFGGIWSLAVSPNGEKVIGACMDTRVRVWDAKTGAELPAWTGHTDRVTGVAWSPDGKLVASCGFDHTVRVWDAANGTLLQTLAAHACPTVRVAFSPDSKHLATSGATGEVLLWKVE